MFKYILVPATGGAVDAAAFATAAALARDTAGHIVFLHVRLDVQKVLVSVSSGDFSGGAGIGDLADQLDRDADDLQNRAHAVVRAFCTAQGIALDAAPAGGMSAEWRVVTGDEGQELALHGRTADLIVLGRARDGEVVELSALEAALLDAGRPLLLVPDGPVVPRPGRRIAIAWKDSAEAARAVAAALPWLAAAETVSIVSVEEDAATTTESCERLRAALAWHNPGVAVRHVQPDGRAPVEVLLDTVAKLDADLVVMGGYSHRRVRELVFGGFTRRVLQAAPVAVLITH